MKTSLKVIATQALSLFLGYVLATVLLPISDNFLPQSASLPISELATFILLTIFCYLFFIVFISNLWCCSINKWNFLTPSIIALLWILTEQDMAAVTEGLKYLFVACVGGWILAKIVNFVVRFAKR